ncbi:MAG: methylated-DNA--[protein]-cysteine S-methyltransferase [Clostridia bacterium]|mgnify:CR=1 FL=1|jgi:methylated-DNA-[protein]-cysteine S-methyltransferase|nr:methylated-DNA--[protein]-cysteine S-methyltransferase [Clostridia bacterium]HPB16161.1 methylated-DNA--[protein]-cysteine S-methyltransferase [Clostridia bacterium]HQM96273.1 methylated-DNA--[protein]-cysteine S-methyltransferase [Clostridia bacterium]HQO69475.1 methylated-DNA--[protein]-cysteine S-methyltransferase [Clostridia bacterium]
MVSEDDKGICGISLCTLDECSHNSHSALTDEAYRQLAEYLDGKRKVFDIKLSLNGTEFQKLVWKHLCKIPYGKTKSYSEIAMLISNKLASRAVGMACNKNPVMILVPCHRVIGKNGSLTGYALGIDMKKNLLDMERNNR